MTRNGRALIMMLRYQIPRAKDLLLERTYGAERLRKGAGDLALRIMGRLGGMPRWRVPPIAEIGHQADQVITALGEEVRHLRWIGEFDLALHHAIGFEFPKLRGQDSFADSGNWIAQLGETPGSETQVPG